MNPPIATYVHGHDPISQAGVISQLRMRPEVRVVDDAAQASRGHRGRRRGRREHHPGAPNDAPRRPAAAGAGGHRRRRCGVWSRRPRPGSVACSDAATPAPETLVRTVQRVASGEGEIPPDLLGRLLGQVGRLQRQVLAPRGLTFTGLTPRETEVLRLVADGHDTSEIAVQLCYSERTVKNVLHDVTTRLQLRNRSHAVAYAVREGLI